MASDILRTTLENHFNATARRPMAYNCSQMYEIINAYHGTLPYWEPKLTFERFETPGGTDEQVLPLLYRPEIVQQLTAEITHQLKTRAIDGVFVTGPQGIGKSFSLVNTVIALESTGDYLVTFLPDGDKWSLGSDVVDAIAASMGVDDEKIGQVPDFHQVWLGKVGEENFKNLIPAISNYLATIGKKWIFVFDQINKLFKKGTKRANSVSELDFPYNVIKNVMRSRHVISIISASANNEAAEIGKHDQFVEYYHPIFMNKTELVVAFPKLTDKRIQTRSTAWHPPPLLRQVINLTAGVPLYAATFLNKFDGDDDSFAKAQKMDMKRFWDKLLGTLLSDENPCFKSSQMPFIHIYCYLPRFRTTTKNIFMRIKTNLVCVNLSALSFRLFLKQCESTTGTRF
jgi:hypothetical protein